MKNKTLAALLLVVLALVAWKKPSNVTIYMIGDSTMADKAPSKYPLTGWGQVFQAYFRSGVTVKNKALDGRTTRSFREEGHWQAVLDSLEPGNYVFIEFGHNDEKVDLPKIGVPLPDYKNYLKAYVNEARSKQAIPVLLTPIMRRSFDNGVFHDTHGAYADAVRQVAAEEHVPLIDLQRKTEKVITDMGDEPSKKLFNWVDSAASPAYPRGSKDNTHLSITGAREVAGLVAADIKAQKMPLAKFLKR